MAIHPYLATPSFESPYHIRDLSTASTAPAPVSAATASEGASSDSPLSVAALALEESSEPSPSAAEPPPAVFESAPDAAWEGEDDFAEHGAMGPPQPPIDGPSATVPAPKPVLGPV